MATCRITSDGVFAENGRPSVLYKGILDSVGDENMAQDLYAMTETPQFKSLAKSLPKDSNDEVSPEHVFRYVADINRSEDTLSMQDRLELNTIFSSIPGVSDSKQLAQVLRKASYSPNGLFLPNKRNLVDSGVFSPYEADLVLDNPDALRKFIDKLENSEKMDNLSVGADQNYVIKSDERTEWGKLKSNNPYKTKKEIVQQYAASDLEGAEIPINGTMERELKEYVRVKEVDDNLNPVLPKQFYGRGIALPEDTGLIDDINFLLTISPELRNSDEALAFVTAIEKNLAKLGIDVIGLHETENYIGILEPLRNFLVTPSVLNMESLEEAYRETFKVNDSQVEHVLPFLDKNRPYVYMDTDRTEQELFEQESLIKTSADNVYLKVRKVPFTEIESFSRGSETLSNISDPETARQIMAYKKIFGYEIKEDKKNLPNDFYTKLQNFDGNLEYLKNDFVLRFNSDILNEKFKDSNKYRTFYSHFGVDDNGIYIKDTDPISMAEIRMWIGSGEISLSDSLLEYSQLSKAMPNLKGIENQNIIEDKSYKRALYKNSPESLPYTSSPYVGKSNRVLTIRNATEDFVKTPSGVYEMVETKGNESIYVKLEPIEDPSFYDFDREAPIVPQNLGDFYSHEEHMEPSSIVEQFLTDKELQKINQENFDCT